MKILSEKLTSSSIAVQKELFDMLKKCSSFVAGIPDKNKGWQTTPLPYFILQKQDILSFTADILEKEHSAKEPNKGLIEACHVLQRHARIDKPALIFVTLTA